MIIVSNVAYKYEIVNNTIFLSDPGEWHACETSESIANKSLNILWLIDDFIY